MTVQISREAEADLEAIGNYIALDNPVRAQTFVRQLTDACLGLDLHPERHPVRTDFSRPVRQFAYRGYSIYYEVLDGRSIRVVHILSDALDHRRYFGSN